MIVPKPVRKMLTVHAPVGRAFEVFTTRMGDWWPKTHSIGKSPQQNVLIEPRVGGRWYEKGEDGTECQWGYVMSWEPPGRVVLAWQLDANWQFNAALLTEVEIRFSAEGDRTTTIELEHRNLDRFGEKAAEVGASLDSEGGWGGLLARYGGLVSAVF